MQRIENLVSNVLFGYFVDEQQSVLITSYV